MHFGGPIRRIGRPLGREGDLVSAKADVDDLLKEPPQHQLWRKSPRVSRKVLRIILSLAIRVSYWFLSDLRSVFLGSPAMEICVFDTYRNRVSRAQPESP